MRLRLFAVAALVVAVAMLYSGCALPAGITGGVEENQMVPVEPADDHDPSQTTHEAPDTEPADGDSRLVRSTIADWVAQAVREQASVNLMVIAPVEGIWATGSEFDGGEAMLEWRENYSRELVLGAVRAILAAYPGSEYVRVIDRSQVDLALDEAEFQSTGLASREDQFRLGEFIGATHVYTIEYNREMGRDLRRETRTTTLLELATGRVLAVDRWTTAAVRDDDTWYEGRSLNGREYRTVDGVRVYVE
jgi:hypothetical protein